MITATLFNVQYAINGTRVWLGVRTDSHVFLLESTQAALAARMSEGATTWGDVEALAETQAQLDARFPDEAYSAELPPLEEES